MNQLRAALGTVLSHLLALAILLASLHVAQTPFEIFSVCATTFVYVTIRGAISFLDFAVSGNAHEEMVRYTGMTGPPVPDDATAILANEEAEDVEARQANFWIDLGFNVLIALIALLNLLAALA
jgi:hypothetical protein